MKNIFFILISSFFFFTNLNASFLLASKNKCIVDYYYKGGYFYYHYDTSPDTLRHTSSKKYELYIFSGYEYDPDTKICSKTQNLGLSSEQYNFLYGLVGLIFGLTFFWLVPKK